MKKKRHSHVADDNAVVMKFCKNVIHFYLVLIPLDNSVTSISHVYIMEKFFQSYDQNIRDVHSGRHVTSGITKVIRMLVAESGVWKKKKGT